jgi:hypothetical protein
MKHNLTILSKALMILFTTEQSTDLPAEQSFEGVDVMDSLSAEVAGI